MNNEFVWTGALKEEYISALERELFKHGALPEYFRKNFVELHSPKEEKEFVWTDELVREYLSLILKGDVIFCKYDTPEKAMAAFKQSHTPKQENIDKVSSAWLKLQSYIVNEDWCKCGFPISGERDEHKYFVCVKCGRPVKQSPPPKPQAENKPDRDWEITAMISDTGRLLENLKHNYAPPYKFQIHSVKRLSDNQVFSVGDEVDSFSHYKNLRIKKFETLGSLMMVYMEKAGEDHGFKISDVQKSKLPPQPQKLFTTEDGVMVDGDEGFVLSTDNWIYVPCKLPQTPFFGDHNQFKYFYHKRNVEQYIKAYKPQDHIGIDRNGEDTKKKRIEVQCFDANMGKHLYNDIYKDEPPFSHVFWTGEKIPTEKLTPIKQAIEQVLNDDEHFFLNKANYDKLPPYLKLYNQQQVDELCEKAFYAGRYTNASKYTYESFEDYKNQNV